MSQRSNAVNGKSALQKIDRPVSITDPEGIVLVLGATVVMSALLWLKAKGLPFKRPRDVVARR